MTREEAIQWLKALQESTLIYGENEEALDIAIETLSEPKWTCTANFVAEQLERLKQMTDEERLDFLKRFFSPSAEQSKVDFRTDKSANISTKVKSDIISRADAIKAIRKCKFESVMPSDWYRGMECAQDIVKTLPSADAEDRLYIKIYADDEPSVKAEKLYQICDETQNREVAEWLKEYFPSADTIPIEKYRELQHCYVKLAATFAEYLQKEATK